MKRTICGIACCLLPALWAGAAPMGRTARLAAAKALLAEVPTGDFYASRPGHYRPDPAGAPLYLDPSAFEQTRLFADDVDYFVKWNCDPSVGPIRHIRKLGIYPLGTHSSGAAKDSLMLAQDAWSGGLPCVVFTHSAPGATDPKSPLYGKTRFFNIEMASFDADQDRWFSRPLVDLPGTTFGVAAADGKPGDFIFQQYQHGMRRGGDGDWLAGMGPVSLLPAPHTMIPAVRGRLPRAGEADTDLYPPGKPYAGYPLFGTGPLGLTTIVRLNHLQRMPYGESPELVQDNNTLFDYGPDGRPRAFYTDAYRQTGKVDANGKYAGLVMGGMIVPKEALARFRPADLEKGPDGSTLVKAGYWAYRFDPARPGAGWQLDPSSRIDVGIHAMNAIRYEPGRFLTSNWTASTVMAYDYRTRAMRVLVRGRAKPHVAMGEPSGSSDLFITLGCQFPYFGKPVGLDDGVFVHDIYLASAYPMEKRNGRYVEPGVVRLFRLLAGRNPDPSAAFRLTHRVRRGVTGEALRKEVAACASVQDAVAQAICRVRGSAPVKGEVAAWQGRLARGGTFADMVRRLAAGR